MKQDFKRIMTLCASHHLVETPENRNCTLVKWNKIFYSTKICNKNATSVSSLLQWAVLTCGHCFCNGCIAIIVEQYSVGSRRRAIKCAICRQTTSHAEISYVFTAQSSSQDQDIPVKVSQWPRISAAGPEVKPTSFILFYFLSGEPLHQGGGCAENAEKDPGDGPRGQVSGLLHGNMTAIISKLAFTQKV